MGAVTAFGLQLILVRVLSLKEYGQYAYILAWANMISVIAPLGFSTSIIRFIPEFTRKNQFAKIKGVINTSLFITFLTGLILATLIVQLLYFSNTSVVNSYAYLIGIIPLMALLQLFSKIERGKKRMFFAHAPIEVFRNILIAAAISIYIIFDVKISLESVLCILCSTIALLLIWHYLELKNGFPATIFDLKPDYEVMKWVKISIPFLLISGFILILNSTDIIMLGLFVGPKEVAIYSISYRIAMLTTFILTAVSAIAAPTIAELYFENKITELKSFAKKTAHLVFWPTLFVIFGTVIFSEFILKLFGANYLDGKLLLYVLLIGQLINASVGAVGYFLNMTGHQKDSAKVFAFAALINLILNPLAIYFYGAIGAASVTAFSMAFWNIWLYSLVRKKLGINSSIF